MTIETIQFRRGLKNALTEYLVDEHKLLSGEPAFESDTGQLKIGDGSSNYADLPYVGAESEDSRFVIHDPVQNQVLLFDSEENKWVNKDLSDSKSIVYLSALGLTIKGYTSAKQGQMLVKDAADGLAWVDPVSTTELSEYVDQAREQATKSANSALESGNSASAADTSAKKAEMYEEATRTLINDKFWWGTVDEYNALTSINPGTFYFVYTGV